MTNNKSLDRITIVGVGAMGGSLAELCRAHALAAEVVGYDRDAASREIALRLGMVDRAEGELFRAVMGSRLVVLALPLPEIFKVARQLATHLRPDVVLTCLAGTTTRMYGQITQAAPECASLVPGFPLVDSPASGSAAASADLLLGATMLLSRGGTEDAEQVGFVAGIWRQLGMEVEILDGPDFEKAVAFSRYLPDVMLKIFKAIHNDSGVSFDNSKTLSGRIMALVQARSDMSEPARQLYAAPLGKLLGLMSEHLQQRLSGIGMPAKRETTGQGKGEND